METTKDYQTPQTKVVLLEQARVICGSMNAGIKDWEMEEDDFTLDF